jgi:hypothetical protein
MSELQRMPEREEKLKDFQKNYNITSKNILRTIGMNMTLYVCILLPMLLIGFIWTDFGVPEIGFKYVSDGIVTVALFVIGELMMMRVGADGGKLDTEYIEAKNVFTALMDDVNDLGTMFMAIFCEWQIDLEMDHAVAVRLRTLRFTRDDWSKIKDLPAEELEARFGKKKAKKIAEIRELEPIELNEAILLYDGENFERGGIPISGEGHMKKKSLSPATIFSWVFTGLVTVSVAITLTSDFSFARVMYTIFKLVVLLFRMASGYNTGAKAYNTIEVRRLQVVCNYLRQYVRFVSDKTYLKLGNKYGDISCYVDDNDKTKIA